MTGHKSDAVKIVIQGRQLKVLTPEQIRRIDELLASLGQYGELHLIIQRGELRYLNRVESRRAWGDEHDSD